MPSKKQFLPPAETRLRSAIKCVICLEDFGTLTIPYGARTPELMLFRDEFENWRKHAQLEVIAEEAGPGWPGRTGLLTSLFDTVALSPAGTQVMVCGPPVMFSFVLGRLEERHFDDSQIYVSLERNMRCGVGKCEHCVVENFYTCCVGPVLSVERIRGVSSALR